MVTAPISILAVAVQKMVFFEQTHRCIYLLKSAFRTKGMWEESICTILETVVIQRAVKILASFIDARINLRRSWVVSGSGKYDIDWRGSWKITVCIFILLVKRLCLIFKKSKLTATYGGTDFVHAPSSHLFVMIVVYS